MECYTLKLTIDTYYSDVLELVKTLDNYEVIYHTSDLHNSEKAEK